MWTSNFEGIQPTIQLRTTKYQNHHSTKTEALRKFTTFPSIKFCTVITLVCRMLQCNIARLCFSAKSYEMTRLVLQLLKRVSLDQITSSLKRSIDQLCTVQKSNLSYINRNKEKNHSLRHGKTEKLLRVYNCRTHTAFHIL